MNKKYVDRNRTNCFNPIEVEKLVLRKFILTQFIHMQEVKNYQLSPN
jgi:hypothetical protein